MKNADFDPQFKEVCRDKFNAINRRCRHRESYVSRGIENSFELEEFVDYAAKKGLQKHYHCHRPDRHRNYEVGNLEFLSPEDHRKVSSQEQRAISPEQARQIRRDYKFLSLRKLAEIYGVSHMTIRKVVKREGVYGSDE